jgi:hypothetical protein
VKQRQLVDTQQQLEQKHKQLVTAHATHAEKNTQAGEAQKVLIHLQEDLKRMRRIAYANPATRKETELLVSDLRLDLDAINAREDALNARVNQLVATVAERERAIAALSAQKSSGGSGRVGGAEAFAAPTPPPQSALLVRGGDGGNDENAVRELHERTDMLSAKLKQSQFELQSLRLATTAKTSELQLRLEEALTTAQLTADANAPGSSSSSSKVANQLAYMKVEVGALKEEVKEKNQRIEQQAGEIAEKMAIHAQCAQTILGLNRDVAAITEQSRSLAQAQQNRESLVAEAKAKWLTMRPMIGCEFRDGPAHGVIVTRVREGRACHLAGVRAGDIIEQVNGVETLDNQEFKIEMQKYQPGDKVPFLIDRKGVILTTVVQIGSPNMTLDDIMTVRRLAQGHVHETDVVL